MQTGLWFRDVQFGERTIALGTHCPGKVVVAVKDETVLVNAERIGGDLDRWPRGLAAPLSRAVYDATWAILCNAAVVKYKFAIDQHVADTACELMWFGISRGILY